MDFNSWLEQNGYATLIFDSEGEIISANLSVLPTKIDTPRRIQDIFTSISATLILSASKMESFSIRTSSDFGSMLLDGFIVPSKGAKEYHSLLVICAEHTIDEFKDAFISKVAHDLRNPIGIAMSHIELLLMNLENEVSSSDSHSQKNISYAKYALEALNQGIDLLGELRKCYTKNPIEIQGKSSVPKKPSKNK